jgi:hypothetical protein
MQMIEGRIAPFEVVEVAINLAVLVSARSARNFGGEVVVAW